MKGKKLRKFLSSIRGHIDSRHSEVVHEKKNIDTSLGKMWKMTEADAQQEDNSLTHSNEAPELRSLIQDLYKQYQSLYGHYDHLIGELMKQAHISGASNGSLTNSSSSGSNSSDSESDNTEDKGSESIKSQKVADSELMNSENSEESLATTLSKTEAAYSLAENELGNMRHKVETLQVENEDLKRQIEQQHALTIQSLQSFEEEKEALLLEKSMAVDRLGQADQYVAEAKIKVTQLEGDVSKLQTVNTSMKEGLQSLQDEVCTMKVNTEELKKDNMNLKQELEMSNQLNAQSNQKIEVLLLEKTTILKKLEEADINAEQSKQDAKQLKYEISKLQEENAILKNGFETKTQQVDDISQTITSINKEKDALISENMDLKLQIEQQHALTIQTLQSFEKEKEALLLEKSVVLEGLGQADQYVAEAKVKVAQLEDEISKLLTENNSMKEGLKCLQDELCAMNVSIEQLKEDNMNLKQDLEKSNQLHCQTNQMNETLLLEKSTILKKLEEADKYAEKYKEEVEQLGHGMSKLQDENGVLKNELETKTQQVDALRERLSSINEEKDALSSENFALLTKIQLADEVSRQLREESDMNMELANERSSQNAKLSSHNEEVTLELQAANQKISDLIQRLSSFEEDSSILKTEILDMERRMQQAEGTIRELNNVCALLEDEKLKLSTINEDLNLQLKVKDDEKTSLYLEHKEFVVKFKEIHENMATLSKELEQANDENFYMKAKYEGLQLELEDANCQIFDAKKMLQVLQEEKAANISEISMLLIKTEGLEKMINELKDEKQRLECDTYVMKREIDDLAVKLKLVEEEKNTLALEKPLILNQLEQAESYLKGIVSEVEQLRLEYSVSQQDLLGSQREISELGRKLEAKEADTSWLQKNLEEASSQIQVMVIDAGNLQKDLDLADRKINELEEHIKVLTAKASKEQLFMENLENELRFEVITQEIVLKEQRGNLKQLLEKSKFLECQYRELSKKLETKLLEVEYKEECVGLLQKVDQEQKLQIEKLEENLKELSQMLKVSEAEKADLDKDVCKLLGQVQTLEVQIRLSNQKLKITETENTEREENHQSTIVALQEGYRSLEAHALALSHKMNLMKDELRRVKEVVEVEMEAFGRVVDMLDKKVVKHCGHMQNQISECSSAIKTTKNSTETMLYEKDRLKNERRDLTMELNYKEGIISMLKEEAGNLGSVLSTKVKEAERLVLQVKDLEQTVELLVKKVKVKEEELYSKDEEKREAIRQLCLMIEYHQENCDHLSKFLLARFNGGRRSA